MKRLKNIVIVFFLIFHNYYFGNPFENCFPCSYFFGGGDTSKNDSDSSDSESFECSDNEVSENSSFSINGLDIYCLDDFTGESFEKYNQIVLQIILLQLKKVHGFGIFTKKMKMVIIMEISLKI